MGSGRETGGLKRAVVYAASGVERAGLRSLLDESESSVMRVVAAAGSAEDLAIHVRTVDVDVIVAHLPDIDDDVLSRILTSGPVLVVLTDDPSADRWVRVSAGQGGFAVLDRHADGDEIRSAALAAATGLCVVQPGMMARLAAGMSLPAALPFNGEALTPREIEVLAIVAEGLGNKTIAYRLGISDHTVKFHVGSILRKLNAESRTEAVTNGLRGGHITI